jgi:hypothetical protein
VTIHLTFPPDDVPKWVWVVVSYLSASRKPLCRRHDPCEALRTGVASLG